MARARHKHVLVTRRRRLVRLGVPVASVLAVAAPAAAVVWPYEQPPVPPMHLAKAVKMRTSPVPMRVAPISRSEDRVEFEVKPPEVVDHKFATTPLNVRTAPSDGAKLLDVLEPAEKIAVTGETRGGWAEVLIGDKTRWVHAAFLADTKPKPEPEPTAESTPSPTPEASTSESPSPEPAGLSTAPCPTGSDVESGLTANAVAVHRAVCAAFPAVTSYGGLRPGDTGEHGTGHALDIMISDSSTGDQIAEWARAHASELGISEVIWSQQIWTVERSSEGWRWMEDRGSVTANHYDHVHVTVY